MALTTVLAAVVRRGAQYLVCRRPNHKRHGGLWEFPGGKVEPGETTHHAIHRELSEELDVAVQNVGAALFAVLDPGSQFVIEFVPVEVRGDPRCIEHSALQWLSLSELPGLELAPSDRRFVEFLLSGEAHAKDVTGPR